MADTSSTTSFKADISQLKAAMQQAQRSVRLATSEFKAATAGMDDWSSSATGLQAKLKQLDTTLKAQKTQLSLLEQEYEKTTEEYGENSAAADRVRIAINNQKAAIAKTESQIESYSRELDDVENNTREYEDALEDLESQVNSSSNGFTVMKGALANLVADGIRLAISAAKDLTKEMLQVGMTFESSMSQVEAVSGATADEMDQLTDKAKEMGSKTKFTASEAADAFNYMAMAGWKTEDMLGGIEGIMNLAAASGADLATTSDIVTDALTAMGYGAEDAGKLADVMAAASSNANTNVEMMGQTFQYAAPIVGALGYNMEDTAVAIGLMANAGIKGEKAGTALRSILTRLSAPPKECADAMEALGLSLTDEAGNMKDMDEVIGDLRKAFNGLSETEQTAFAKQIAGQEAMSGLLSIVRAAPADYDKLTLAVKNSEGAAQSMADTMQDNVAGQITLLQSKIQGIMIQIFEKLEPQLRKGIEEVSDLLDDADWDKAADKIGDFAGKIIGLFKWILNNGPTIKAILAGMIAAFAVTKIAAIITAIVGMVSTIKTLVTAIKAATTAQEIFNAVQAANPIGLVATAVGLLVAGITLLASRTIEAEKAQANFTEAEQKEVDTIRELNQAYVDLKAARDENVQAINTEFGYYDELMNELDSYIDGNGKVNQAYYDRANFIMTTLNEALGTEITMTDGVIANYQTERAEIEKLIETKRAQAILDANEESYTTAIQGRNEALTNLTNAQAIYQTKLDEMTKAEQAYNEVANMSVNEYAKLHGLTNDLSNAAELLANDQAALKDKWDASRDACGESLLVMQGAERTYDSYMNTIKNYEGLSAAIISGDADKISQSLLNMEYDFKTAENSTRQSLENQVANYETNLANLQQAIENGTPGVTQEMVDQAASMVDAAKKELNKLPKDAGDTGKEVVDGLNKSKKDGADAGKDLALAYGGAIIKEKQNAYNSGENLAQNANKGADSKKGDAKNSGYNFGQGFINGINAKGDEAYNASFNLAKKATAGLKAGQKEGSPSKLTTQSGIYFGEGYELGIGSMVKTVAKSAGKMATEAYNSLRKAQKEGSPSKLTYESGVNFVKGYINGIVSQRKDLFKAVKGLISDTLSKALSLKDFNFDEVAEDVTTYFSDSLSESMSYMISKMTYQNEQKLKDFDDTIKNLTEKLNNEKNEDLKKQYQAQIDEQNKLKAAYQSASSAMISEFSAAMNQYQSKANALINATINGITDTYQARYNEFIGKQNDLINKLKGAGELFEISGAGVMTVTDIKEQTKQIQDYADKLQKIKGKVSEELFDEITSYDMKEGSAFLDRLLAMNEDDLKAYADAYDEKMNLAKKLGEETYKKDLDRVAKSYKVTIDKAFQGLPEQLEKIGQQTIQGFINGFTKNTDYMDDKIKTFVKAMVDSFKKELKIGSPSKLTYLLGDFTGQGFVNGLKDTITAIKKTAGAMASAVATPLDSVKTNIGDMKAAVNGQNGVGTQNTSSVVNNYNLVQNNTSPKSLSALQTYQARRQQIAMVKAMT